MKQVFGSLRKLFQAPPRREAATAIYGAILAQSRLPVFYLNLGVPDTVDGRFDMIVMHAFLVISRLKHETEDGNNLAQEVFDVMFEDMDRGLRLLGSSDVRVGKRIKAMAQAFYGRVHAYEEGLTSGREALARVVHRNVFRGAAGTEALAEAIAGYVQREAESLARLDLAGLLAGQVGFGTPPAPEGTVAAGKD